MFSLFPVKTYQNEREALQTLRLYSNNYSKLKQICIADGHQQLLHALTDATCFEELLNILNQHDINAGDTFINATVDNVFKKILFFTGSCLPSKYFQAECQLSLSIVLLKEEIEENLALAQNSNNPYKFKMD